MPFPINTVHRLALEDGTSLLLLEDNTSKVILDEAIALDDPLNAATVTTLTPGLTFVGENIAGNNLTYEIEVDTVNTFDSLPSGGSPITVDSYSESNQSNTFDLVDASNNTFGQTFTAQGGILDNVVFYIDKGGTPLGTCAVKIYAISGTYGTNAIPTGTALATSDAITASSLSTSLALVTFNFTGANRITLSSGGQYAASLEYASGSTGNSVHAGYDSTAPTHSGNFFRTSAATLAGFSSADACFYVNVVPNLPLLDKTSDLNTGFTDDATLNADDKLLLETGNSGGSLLLEDNSSHLIINYSYPQNDYMTYTVPGSTLSNSTTYYWRARQKVQNGGSYPVTWSEIRSFTISLSVGGAALSSTLLMMNVG